MPIKTWTSLPQMFFDQARAFGNKPFLWAHDGERYRPVSWEEAAGQAARLARALQAFGVKPGERVAILAENRPEWVIAAAGVMALGAITVPLYITNTARDHAYVLENSGAKAAIVSTAKLAKEFLPAAHQQNTMKNVILVEPLNRSQNLNVDLHAWKDLLAKTEPEREALEREVNELKRDAPCCIIYTSGTGGAPKGVVLHHGSILHNVEGAAEVLKFFGLKGNRFLSFIPMSHAYGHMGDLFLPIAIGAEIYFAQSVERLSANMLEAKPTVMLVVPRLFETIKGRVEAALKKQGSAKRKLFARALALGAKRLDQNESLSLMEKIEDKCLDLLVRRKVKKRFGGRIKALVSGGAALNAEVGGFFAALGLTVLQGYGQTESGPLISVNTPPDIRIDTVGPPVKNTEVKIADDGEVLARGELVMKGYWQDPEGTAVTLRDGWLHTGDIGRIDESGHLRITDRKKDIIVFDKGDNVSPQRIEGLITLEPEIAQAMVYGDGHSHLVGLLVPDEEWLEAWAEKEGKEPDLAKIADDRDLRRALAPVIERVNRKVSGYERVRRFMVASEPFSVENDQLTPTLKIRRHAIKKIYAEKLEALY